MKQLLRLVWGGGVFPLKRLGEAGRHESGAAVGWGKADRVAV